ncbi:M48 family metallopeptidase [Fusibacter bizertensis]|nr:SprT family zinc-dependent metalloprotease [Fusibacter bizertensis]
MMTIKYGTQTIEFTVTYSKRKTIEIGVEPPNAVSVVAPEEIDDDILIKHVKSKAKWIVQKLYEIKEIQSQHIDREYVNGEAFMYLGRNYTLEIVDDQSLKKPVTKLFQGKFIIYTPTRESTKLKASMVGWYRHKTLEKVNERIVFYQKYFDLKPADVRVKEQKKRWASCTSKGELIFNWRCVMAPSWVLDYVVVHEMCHLQVMDHSKEFWSLVERIMPDYDNRRKWLRNYGIRMDL